MGHLYAIWGMPLTFWIRAAWFVAMEIGVSSIPVSEVCTQFSDLDMTFSCHLALVLLRATRIYRGKLYSLFILQRFRYLEGSRRAPAEPQKVSGIEKYRIEDVVSCVVKLVQWLESRLCCVRDTEYNSSDARWPQSLQQQMNHCHGHDL